MDPLLAEIDLRVIVCRYCLWNTPEEGIMPPLGIVIRRSVG